MAIEVPQNEEISGGGKDGGRKGVDSAICWGGANRGAYTLRKNTVRNFKILALFKPLFSSQLFLRFYVSSVEPVCLVLQFAFK